MAAVQRSVPTPYLGADQGGGGGGRRDNSGVGGGNQHLAGSISKVALTLIWVLAAIPLVPLSYWAVGDTLVPLDFVSAEARPESGEPGAKVIAYYHVNVLRGKDQCAMDVERSWTDFKGFGWPSPTAHLPYNAGPQTIALTMIIPMDAALGPAKIANRVVYHCNPWQSVFPRRQEMPPLTVAVTR